MCVCVSVWSSGHEFLLRQWDCVKKGLHRRFAEAPTSLMWSTMVVFDQPGVEIGLQLVDRVIDLFAERDPVKLIQDGAMEALADAIGLRALSLCAAVIDVLNGEIELVFMALGAAKRLRARKPMASASASIAPSWM